MMSYSFHAEAEQKFHETTNYYECCSPGLGLDFALEVQATIQNVREYPSAWPTLDDDIHRCLTPRFPYGVVYCVENGTVVVLAVMHLHRDPEYWKARI